MALTFKSNYPQIARESGFRLRQFKDGPLDWRLVGSMEVDRILREQQFEHIDGILFHLSEAPLASMLESNILDSGVAKYFTLSQLALQYMIFCRKFLDESVKTLRENIIKLETQNLHFRTINQEHTENILHLHKKLSQVEAIHDIVFPCHVCTKNFVSNDALNVHLSKKHLKSPLVDIEGKDKDRTLINTIKLELEIKQLKERLNIAEKDIRQSREIKKELSPREITKLNSSTQVEIQTRNVGTQRNFDKTKRDESSPTTDIGTQCNLFETKEFDSTEELGSHSIFNVLKESDYDVKNVEANKADILFDIQEKISKLEALQKTYSSGNQQSINEIQEKLTEITEFLETQTRQIAENMTKDVILSESPTSKNLPSKSVDALHQMLSNMFSEVSQLNFEKTNRIITKMEKSYEQKLSKLEVENEKKKQLQPFQAVQALESPYSMNKGSIKQKIEVRSKDVISSSYLSKISNSIEETSKYTSSDGRSDSFSSTNTSKVESQHSIFSLKENASDDSNALNKLENKMALYGLNINSKSISVPEAAKISGHLLKQRNNQVYPTFHKTRNRLNQLVELLISEKKLYRQRLKKHEKNHKKIYIAKPKNEFPLKIDANIASRKSIEKILKPPIKKPTSYVARYNKDEIKPVPMPRKHVVFHTEKTDRESPLNLKSFTKN